MLPLGLRVQDKLERLIDKHMRSVGELHLSIAKHPCADRQRRIQGFVIFVILSRAMGAVWSVKGGLRGEYPVYILQGTFLTGLARSSGSMIEKNPVSSSPLHMKKKSLH